MEDLGIWTLIVLIGGAVSIGGAIIRGLKGLNTYQHDRGQSSTVLDAHGLDVDTLQRFNPNLLGAVIPVKSSDLQHAVPLQSVAVLYLLGDSPESSLKADLTLGTKGLTIVPHGLYERMLAYSSLEYVSSIEPAGTSDLVILLTDSREHKVVFANRAQRDEWFRTWQGVAPSRVGGTEQAEPTSAAFAYPLLIDTKGPISTGGEVKDADGTLICRISTTKFSFMDLTPPLEVQVKGNSASIDVRGPSGESLGTLIRKGQYVVEHITINDAANNIIAVAEMNTSYECLIRDQATIIARIQRGQYFQFTMVPEKPMTLPKEHERLILIAAFYLIKANSH